MAGPGQKAHHEKFISIWQKLFPVYKELKEVLKEKEMAYGGMISRQVIEKSRDEAPQFEFKKYYIIGLNALNNCEKTFFDLLKKQ